MTPPVNIAGLREKAEAATPGPWEVRIGDDGVDLVATDGTGDLLAMCMTARDAAFASAARSAVPALLDALEEAESCADPVLLAFKRAPVVHLDESDEDRAELSRRTADIVSGRVKTVPVEQMFGDLLDMAKAENDQLRANLAAARAKLEEAEADAADAVVRLAHRTEERDDVVTRLAVALLENARLRAEVDDLKAELVACRDVNVAARRCVAIDASGDLHRRLAQLALALRRPAKSDGEGGVG